MNNPYRSLAQEYLKNQIENSSPAQQLVLLYDGAIKFTLQARDAIINGDVNGRYTANRRTMEIVGYLLEILDLEKGGEVAMRLQRIYSHLLKKLLEVDFKNSTAVCEEVMESLRTLRTGWQQIAEQNRAPMAPAASVAPAAPVQPTFTAGQGSNPTDLPLPPRRNAVA